MHMPRAPVEALLALLGITSRIYGESMATAAISRLSTKDCELCGYNREVIVLLDIMYVG